jgi:hypothetical protein
VRPSPTKERPSAPAKQRPDLPPITEKKEPKPVSPRGRKITPDEEASRWAKRLAQIKEKEKSEREANLKKRASEAEIASTSVRETSPRKLFGPLPTGREEYTAYERSRPEVNALLRKNAPSARLVNSVPKTSFLSFRAKPQDLLHKDLAQRDEEILNKVEDGKPLAEAFLQYKEQGDLEGMKKIADRATLLQTMLDTGLDINQ